MSESALDYGTLILGGGFAGVYCAKALARWNRRHPDDAVGLIADENYMVFQPMLPEVASASLSPRHTISPIRQLCPGVDVYKGSVTRVDARQREVHVNAGDFSADICLKARRLVFALGATIDLSRVPGMPEHALLMQNVGDAMRLRATLLARFEEANLLRDPEQRRSLLSFIVVGGGYSGVETAGQIQDLLVAIHRYYQHVGREDFSVTLIHSQAHLLPTLAQSLGDYAQRKLEANGIHVILGHRVRAITASQVVLDNGETLVSRTVVSTVGNAPHPVILDVARQLGLETHRGRLKTLPTLQIEGAEELGLWAIGDCAAVPLPKAQQQRGVEVAPPTAQYAQREGTTCGANLKREAAGKALEAFQHRNLGELAAIGHRSAVAEIMGLRFSGFFAWWLWRSIYVFKLPGIQKKLRVILDWTFDLFFPRDINLLNPRYSKLLKAMHLEAGEVLFHPGEPAFSLYVVQSGAVELHEGERLLKTVEAGETFGERALLEDRTWRYRARAREATNLISLGAPEFQALVEGSEALRRLFRRSALSYSGSQRLEALKAALAPATLDKPAQALMNRTLDTLGLQMSLRQAFEVIRVHRHGSYPVIDGAGKLAGVLGRDDLYDAFKREGMDSRIEDLALTELPTVAPDVNGAALLERLLRSGRNKLLVLDAEGCLLGILTLADLIEDSLEAVAAGGATTQATTS